MVMDMVGSDWPDEVIAGDSCREGLGRVDSGGGAKVVLRR